MRQWSQDNWEYSFETKLPYIADTDLPFQQPECLRILPNCFFAWNKVRSDDSPIAYAKFLHVVGEGSALLPEVEEEAYDLDDVRDSEENVPLEEMYPWLSHIDGLPFDPKVETASGFPTTDVGQEEEGCWGQFRRAFRGCDFADLQNA